MKKSISRERDWQTMKESTTDPPPPHLSKFILLLYQILSFGPLHYYGKNKRQSTYCQTRGQICWWVFWTDAKSGEWVIACYLIAKINAIAVPRSLLCK
jgi:hypothetical protein